MNVFILQSPLTVTRPAVFAVGLHSLCLKVVINVPELCFILFFLEV